MLKKQNIKDPNFFPEGFYYQNWNKSYERNWPGLAIQPAAGNKTEQLVEIASNLGNTVGQGTELVGGTELFSAFSRIAFKTTKDRAGWDTVCNGLCLVSGTCERVALCCSTIKAISFRGRIYIATKIISRGWMSFQNACAGEGC